MVRIAWWIRPGTETALDDFESAALSEHHGRGGNTNVLERDVSVTVWCVVVAVDAEHAINGDACSSGGHENDGLLAVFVGVVGRRLAHDDVDLAATVTCAGRPPFVAVEDPVAVGSLFHGELNVGSV